MPESDSSARPVRTGLIRMRQIADSASLSGALAPEPPDTIGPNPSVETQAVHPLRKVTDAEQVQMMREWAAGANVAELETKYGVTRGYIRAAMIRKFGSKENMLHALENLILENAVGAQMIAQEKLHELSGAQAVFAGKLLVETAGSLRAQMEKIPKTINFGEFKRLGDTLREVRALVNRKACSPQPQPPSDSPAP